MIVVVVVVLLVLVVIGDIFLLCFLLTLFTFPNEDYGWCVPKKSKNTFKIICGLKIVPNPSFSTIPARFAVEMPNPLSNVKTRFFFIKKKWCILGKVKRVSGKV